MERRMPLCAFLVMLFASARGVKLAVFGDSISDGGKGVFLP